MPLAPWVALLVPVTNAAHVALAFIIQSTLARFYLTEAAVCAGWGAQGHHYKIFKSPCQDAKVH